MPSPVRFRVGRSLGTTIYRNEEDQPCAIVPNDKQLAEQIVDLLNGAASEPAMCTRAYRHDGPCNGLPRLSCVTTVPLRPRGGGETNTGGQRVVTVDDVVRESRAGTMVVIVCRYPDSFNRTPGTLRGYHCIVCNREVEATPNGQRQIAAGGAPLCNPCGLLLAEEAKRDGKLGGFITSPEAEADLRSGRMRPGEKERVERLRREHPYRGRT